ncbi:MAG: hypothetical protein APF84_03660 [Gracilibacter sp. BRH_c7a]|nr:MAG: hypothetical protein APF84_03660 [Gracilibacter sp. BRH_c7a]
MVQIGNIHIGTADTATQSKIDIGEAFILSQHLYFRYFCTEQTIQYYNAAHDSDFKQVIKIGLTYLEKEVKAIEKQMEKYKVPQPSRSPKSVKVSPPVSTLINDHYIFEQIRCGCTAAAEKNLRNAIMILNNDSLREMFIDFLKDEIDMINNLLKYGKLKGWLPTYPVYKAD